MNPGRWALQSNRGALVSGIAVHLRHLWHRPLLGQVGLEMGQRPTLGVVSRLGDLCKIKISIIPNTGTDKLYQDGSKQFNMVKKLTG